jgi:transposase
LREVYVTTSRHRARRRLERFHDHCRAAQVRELDRLGATVRRWEHELRDWHRTGLSNRLTDAMNLLIKKVKRVGHSLGNLETYRLRLLLPCGIEWRHTRPVEAIRGSQPSVVA